MPPFVSQIGRAETIRLIRVSVRSVRFVLFRCVSGRGVGGGRCGSEQWTVDGLVRLDLNDVRLGLEKPLLPIVSSCFKI